MIQDRSVDRRFSTDFRTYELYWRLQVHLMAGQFSKFFTLSLVLIAAWPVTLFDSLASICAAAESANSAHPVSVVEADIYVGKFKTTMRLKCFAEDLELLQGVEPYEDGNYDNKELVEATRDHAKYLNEKILIMDVDGVPMKGKVIEIIDFDIPEEGIPSGQLMNYSMGYVIEYSYDAPPEFITINQQMVAEGALLPSELKILMKQAGSDTPYTHMMKPDQPETFSFDWDKPLLSSDASETDWKAWFEEQREKTLGITSYSSVYSFIYITDHEVRNEVLIPLATLTTMMEFERADKSFLDIPEQDLARKKIEQFFSMGNPVQIDGQKIEPIFDNVQFYGLDLRDFAMQSERRKVSMASGRVGIIMRYPAKKSPQKVEVTWDVFNSVIRSVDAVVFPHDEVKKTEFSKFLENNTYTWENPGRPELPKITTVDANIDVAAHQPLWPKFPWLTALMLVAATVLLAGTRVQGGGQVVARMLGGLLIVGAVLCVPYFQTDLYPTGNKFSISDEKASEVFYSLHTGLFRAFDFHDEADVYDSLAQSVDGELLRELYLQINESLRVQEQGGAIARIEKVELLDGEVREPNEPFDFQEPGFAMQAKWNLVGEIEHWGHIHERTNQYDALFTVQIKDNAWKITSMDVIDQPPAIVKTRVRKF